MKIRSAILPESLPETEETFQIRKQFYKYTKGNKSI